MEPSLSNAAPRRAMPTLVRSVRASAAGVYAWLVTVALPAWGPAGNLTARISAGFALAALMAGAVLVASWPSRARWGGVYGLGAFSIATWALAPGAISLDQLDAVRAGFGGLGWLLHVLAWSSPSLPPPSVPNVEGRVLSPRVRFKPAGVAAFAVAVATALLLLALAWRVTQSEHAFLAQASAVLASVGVLSTGAELGVRFGSEPSGGSVQERLRAARLPLLALVTLLGLGFGLWVLR